MSSKSSPSFINSIDKVPVTETLPWVDKEQPKQEEQDKISTEPLTWKWDDWAYQNQLEKVQSQDLYEKLLNKTKLTLYEEDRLHKEMTDTSMKQWFGGKNPAAIRKPDFLTEKQFQRCLNPPWKSGPLIDPSSSCPDGLISDTE